MKNKKYIRMDWWVDNSDGCLICSGFEWVDKKGVEGDGDNDDEGSYYWESESIVEELEKRDWLEMLEWEVKEGNFEFDLA